MCRLHRDWPVACKACSGPLTEGPGLNTTNKLIFLWTVLVVPISAVDHEVNRSAAPTITMVVEHRGSCVGPVFEAMKREFEFVMEDLDCRFEWAPFDEAAGRVFSRIIVVRLCGRCEASEFPRKDWRLGPLGLAHMTDGEILPFVDVHCDHVWQLLAKGPVQGPYLHSSLLLGRALGRVLAHEVYHVLARSARHSLTGLARANLTAKDLTEAGVRFLAGDLASMREGLGVSAVSLDPAPSPSPSPVKSRPSGLRRTLR